MLAIQVRATVGQKHHCPEGGQRQPWSSEQPRGRTPGPAAFRRGRVRTDRAVPTFWRRIPHWLWRPCEVIGPSAAVAGQILSKSPLGVALSILHLEWTPQLHYVASVRKHAEAVSGVWRRHITN